MFTQCILAAAAASPPPPPPIITTTTTVTNLVPEVVKDDLAELGISFH
jgi:hypothetical protein